MVFDSRAYEDTVLKPMRRLLPNLPDDLQTRYAVDPASMDAAALRERVETVVKLWNKLALRAGHGGMVAKQLAHEHQQLEAGGNDLGDPGFWKAWLARRRQSVGTAIEELAAQLKDEYGTLGVITKAQLRAAAEGGLGDAELDQARAKAGLQVVEPVALPAKPEMRGQLKVLNDALIEAGVQSIPELLFAQLTEFGLVNGLMVEPRPQGRTVALNLAAGEERMLELDRLPDSGRVRSVRNAVGLVVAEAKAGVDLTALALFHVLQQVRERQRDGVGSGTLFALLVRKKVRRADAGRIVVSLLGETGSVRDPAAEVVELLAEGRLLAAQQLAAALSGEDGETARAAVQRVHEQVAALRSAARAHLHAGRDEQAGDVLRQAVALASDLPELAAQLAGVPAPAVLAASATADGSGVRVTWRPAPAHGESTKIAVVRGRDRKPESPDDGTPIAVAGSHAADAAPPIGVEVHYAVFTRVGGGRWSRPTAASVRVVPPVSDVVVEGGKGTITGRWNAHPAVVAIEVHRSEGSPDAPSEPVRVGASGAFRDESVRDGIPYFYSVVAVYPSPTGGPSLRSAAVVVRGTTRVDAGPIASLNATLTYADGPTVRLTFRQQPGCEVVLRRAGSPCPWEYGTRVGRAELSGWGTELRGAVTVRETSATLVAAVPPGRSWIVPFTVTHDGAVRGQHAYVELIEPVRGLAAQRFGDDVRVTWIWPDDVSAADVTWSDGHRRITLAHYREEGGCVLRAVRGVRRVHVQAVVIGGGDEACATPVSVAVAERPAQLRYTLSRRGLRLAGGVKVTVTLSSPDPVTRATLLLVVSAGAVMPLTPDVGIELLREIVSVPPGAPLALPEVAVPNVLRKPYWLRCFLLDSTVELLDPPVSQLKVS
jgi:hypothetical protein